MNKRVFSLILALATAVIIVKCAKVVSTSVVDNLHGRSEQSASSSEQSIESEPVRESSQPETYEVRFKLKGGTLVSGELTQEVEKGHSATAPVVEREGFIFDGWDKDFYKITSDLVVEPLWTRCYSIRFNPNGGRIDSGELEQQIPEGTMPTAPTVSMDGSEFLAWEPAIEPASADKVYTAQWGKHAYAGVQIYDRIYTSVVEITIYDAAGTEIALGTGFFIDGNGTVVTNYHVIEGAYSAKAKLYDETVRDIAYIVDYSENLDLALLHVDVRENAFLKRCQDEIVVGENVYSLGSPYGLSNTFTSGIVSASGREDNGVSYIQTTAPVSPGNSGGPLVNSYCEVVGINAMTVSGGQNLNFAISVNELDRLDFDGQIAWENYRKNDGTDDFYLGERPTITSDYLLPNSDTEYITEEDLKYLTWEECCLARNEIFARHGRIFKSPEIAAYFESKSWYVGTISGEEFDANNKIYLNEIEIKNAKMILEYEKKHWGKSYY